MGTAPAHHLATIIMKFLLFFAGIASVCAFTSNRKLQGAQSMEASTGALEISPFGPTGFRKREASAQNAPTASAITDPHLAYSDYSADYYIYDIFCFTYTPFSHTVGAPIV